MATQHDYFNQEMIFLRQSVESFSQTYPEVASELKLSAGRSTDPHVEQLLQSFAFMTARLRNELQSKCDQIPNQLLHSLYPSLIRSLPCMTVLQANVENDGANFINRYCLAKGRNFIGHAKSKTSSTSIECKFSNCYDTPLWPLSIEKIKVQPKNIFPFLGANSKVTKNRVMNNCLSIMLALFA